MINFANSSSFECQDCHGVAEIVVDDDELRQIRCVPCGHAYNGADARFMYETLIDRFRVEKGRDLMRQEVRKRWKGRIPRTKVADRYSDPRWPFVLKVEIQRKES